MKKFLFIGLLFVAGNVFCQTLSKEQEKQVKNIHKQVQKEIDDVIDSPDLSAEDKKNRISAAKDKRDAQLANVVSAEQAFSVKAKDPVKWDKAISKVDKQESAKLKTEMNEKLDVLDDQAKELDGRESEIKDQIRILKKEQDEVNAQQKALKNKRKGVKAQYVK